MAKYYCGMYFYPEKYGSLYKCSRNERSNWPCECRFSDYCYHKLHLDNEQFAMLDSLRAVKEQNLKILEQNKKIIEELALQQLQKFK